MNQKPELKLDWCSYEAAKYAVEHWHYSCRAPHGKQQSLGVWEDGSFIGALAIGRSITPWLGHPYGLTQHQCAELTRVALKEHVSQVSRIVAIAVTMIRRLNPGLRLLVSYADPNHGHYGGIYQAMNWIYDGVAGERRQWNINGHWRNDTHTHRMSAAQRSRYQTRVIIGKYRYLYPLDESMRSQIVRLAKPYPKRAASIAPDAPSDQGGEDGRQPIAALHDPGVSV